jgi:hypothetical protein
MQHRSNDWGQPPRLLDALPSPIPPASAGAPGRTICEVHRRTFSRGVVDFVHQVSTQLNGETFETFRLTRVIGEVACSCGPSHPNDLVECPACYRILCARLTRSCNQCSDIVCGHCCSTALAHDIYPVLLCSRCIARNAPWFKRLITVLKRRLWG